MDERPTHSVTVPVSTVWTSPEAPNADHRLLVQPAPDVPTWSAGLDDRLRRELHDRTLTQALLGEPVVVDELRGGWARVRLPWQPARAGAYPGWLPSTHLVDPALPAGPAAVVRRHGAVLDDGDLPRAVSLGTVLPLAGAGLQRESAGSAVSVLLPSGGTGTLPRADVRLRPGDLPDRVGAARTAMATAALLTGRPYVWGGTSGWGVDCSGLVHLAYRAAGVVVPRDARDQHASLGSVPPDEALPADLYFFARDGAAVHHVGFVTGSPGERPRMLHAPETGGTVEEVVLPPERLRLLIGAGRIR